MICTFRRPMASLFQKTESYRSMFVLNQLVNEPNRHTEFGHISGYRQYQIGSERKCDAIKLTKIRDISMYSTSTNNKDEYKLFYRFPHIRAAALISRLKVYQTGLTLGSVPVVLYWYSIGAVDLLSVQMLGAISTLALAVLYIYSGFFRKLVGVMNINQDGTIVRIGHMNFWGKRTNTFVEVKDIVPLSDSPDTVSDAYVKLMTYDSDKFWYLSIKHGNIIDEELFVKAFGSIM